MIYYVVFWNEFWFVFVEVFGWMFDDFCLSFWLVFEIKWYCYCGFWNYFECCWVFVEFDVFVVFEFGLSVDEFCIIY